MTVIVVSGTPATGKTTVAKKIAKACGYKYVDVNKIIKENKLCEEYDKARHCNIVDVEKLKQVLANEIAKGADLVIDSHMAHFLGKKYVDLVVITTCELKTLEKRLRERKYPESKVRENLDAQIFEICKVEAEEAGHTILEIDTEKEIEIKKITQACRG